MIKLEKPTTHDLIETILDQHSYPDPDATGHAPNWRLSSDIEDERSIQCMELEELFVDCVAKSKELPFVFEKTLNGTTLKKENRLGKLFYELLSFHDETANPDGRNRHSRSPTTFKTSKGWEYKNYEVSENLQILHSVAAALDLGRANFNYNPMSEMGDPGLLEGELINSFVTRLREATKQKSVITKLAERKKSASQCFTKTKRYLDRLFANCPDLFGVHMVLCYENIDVDHPLSLKESHGHLIKFLEILETGSDKESLVGWWWKREYMTELGYHHHLILFFDGNAMRYDPNAIRRFYEEEWGSVTRNKGYSFKPLEPDNGQRSRETTHRLMPLVSMMQRMVLRDIFLKLKKHQKLDHLGMGKLPKSVEEMPPQTGHTSPCAISRHDAPN